MDSSSTLEIAILVVSIWKYYFEKFWEFKGDGIPRQSFIEVKFWELRGDSNPGKVLLKLSSGNSGGIAIQAKFYSSQVLVNSGEHEMAFLDVLLKLNWGTQGIITHCFSFI